MKKNLLALVMADQPLSIAHHYHQRTKYDPDTLAQTAKRPDWDNQPGVFKEYKVGATYSLKPFLSGKAPQLDETIDPTIASNPDQVYAWKRLSRLFLCSYGLTAKMLAIAQNPIYFRAVPSAGGLYPAEVYLISRGTHFLPPGLYHYQAQTHSLIHFWDSPVWNELQQACFWHPALENTQMALVTTAIFFRSAWRYQARAYRRICLDTGHLLGNIELAASINDYRPHLIGGFADEALNQLLYLDGAQEGAIALLPLADMLKVEQNLPLFPTAAPSIPDQPSSRPTSDSIDDDDLLAYFHQATQIKVAQDINWRHVPRRDAQVGIVLENENEGTETEDSNVQEGQNTPEANKPEANEPEANKPEINDGYQSPQTMFGSGITEPTLSTQQNADADVDTNIEPDIDSDTADNHSSTPSAEIQAGDSYNFPFCYKVSMVSPSISWGNDLLELEQTMLKRRSTREYSGAVLTLNELKALLDFTYQPYHYVEQGLERNPDYFDVNLLETFIAVSGVQGLDEGCYYYAPIAQELRQIRFKNFRRELHVLCLGQSLGRDAGAVIFHTADLSKAVKQYGDRAYRYLHLDAGHLGQRLNLAAIRLGLGVSGIGGFFDDTVNEVLGIPVDEAVIYITTLGRPK